MILLSGCPSAADVPGMRGVEFSAKVRTVRRGRGCPQTPLKVGDSTMRRRVTSAVLDDPAACGERRALRSVYSQRPRGKVGPPSPGRSASPCFRKGDRQAAELESGDLGLHLNAVPQARRESDQQGNQDAAQGSSRLPIRIHNLHVLNAYGIRDRHNQTVGLTQARPFSNNTTGEVMEFRRGVPRRPGAVVGA